MNCSLLTCLQIFRKYTHLLVFRLHCFSCLKTWFTKFVKVKKNKWFWILLPLYTLFNKELRINYNPEIRNGSDVWKQAFRSQRVVASVTNRTDERVHAIVAKSLLPYITSDFGNVIHTRYLPCIQFLPGRNLQINKIIKLNLFLCF